MNYTLEELIEAFINAGMKAYKKQWRNTPDGRSLDRHQTVQIPNAEVSCWRELATYQMGKHLQEIMKTGKIEVILDGNNSTLSIELEDDKQEEEIKEVIFNYFKECKLEIRDFL